ncbi:ABC transporter ATP-binding protein [Deltaproteobacteria bacterium TL4]
MSPLLQVQGLHKHFPVRKGLLMRQQGVVSVLNGITFDLNQGEILGIVGESGCGKSTLARTIMKIFPPTQGQICFEKEDIFSIENRKYFHQTQMIFQDPFSSLNPKMRIHQLLKEMIHLHQPEAPLHATIERLLDEVGLPSSAQFQYPHEFSGGQRQRIAIARALAASPRLLIADEPVSALDVSIQAQILNLLQDLQKRYQLSLIFISHDLTIVNHFCHRVLVMYLGKIVEELPGQALFQAQHPYTQALLNSMPGINKRSQGIKLLEGDPPSPIHLPKGCFFQPRCNVQQNTCQLIPPQTHVAPNHQVSCFFPQVKPRV